MAFLTVRDEQVATEGQSGYFSTSGIYPVTLKHCEIKGTPNGATQANYYFDKGMSFGNTLMGVNSQEVFGYKVLEALAVVIGESELSDPEAREVKFKTSTKELNCIPELTDVSVQVWVQYAYGRYNNEITEKISVKRFYRETDGASGSEIIGVLAATAPEDAKEATGKIGAQLTKDKAYATEVKYDDGVTADEVATWKKAKSGAGGPTQNAAAAAGFPGASSTGPVAGFPGTPS